MAAPAPTAQRLPLSAVADSSKPQVFTIRYVAFIARPKTAEVVARYKSFPPVLDQNWNGISRYAMITTPAAFAHVLRADQPDFDFIVSFVGSDILYNTDTTQTQINRAPDPSDPYGLALVDDISVSQNSDTTLDFVSKGKLSFSPVGLPEMGGAMSWDGENNELMIGRTYKWGAQRQADGTCVTWAFCILPGRLDQVASAWKRHDRIRATVLASNKASGRRLGQ